MTRGGFRTGAGRKKNSGQYKEPTKAVQVPLSLFPSLEKELERRKRQPTLNQSFCSEKSCPLPLYTSLVSAGYPFIGDDTVDEKLDLNDTLIKNPATTFFVRVEGESMIGAGIHDKDLLIVDRSLQAKSGSIVIVALNGELTVKCLVLKEGKMELHPKNPDYPIIHLKEEMSVHIWGVVTNVVHPFV